MRIITLLLVSARGLSRGGVGGGMRHAADLQGNGESNGVVIRPLSFTDR